MPASLFFAPPAPMSRRTARRDDLSGTGGLIEEGGDMLALALKAAISGVLIAVASTLAKRYPGFGALVASLPLVSVLGMIWLWSERPDPSNMAAHVEATFWYVLPSLPMFLVIPVLLRHGMSFWVALALGCALIILLYATVTTVGPRFGLRL